MWTRAGADSVGELGAISRYPMALHSNCLLFAMHRHRSGRSVVEQKHFLAALLGHFVDGIGLDRVS